MQIRKFSPFIQIPRTSLHRAARLMDAAPLGGTRGRGTSAKEVQGAGSWLVWATESRGWLQTYDPIGKSNIRPTPHRDIHLPRLYIPPAITFPGVVSTSVLYRPLTYVLTIGKISIFGSARGINSLGGFCRLIKRKISAWEILRTTLFERGTLYSMKFFHIDFSNCARVKNSHFYVKK